MKAFCMHPAVLSQIMDILHSRGYTIIGPKVRSSAVVLDELVSSNQLPLGWRDHQAPGVYTAGKTSNTGFFQTTCGPRSWKWYLYPPRARLFKVRPENGGPRLDRAAQPAVSYAFLGMRACDLKAMEILDGVLSRQVFQDPDYQAVRRKLFIVAANCLQPGQTCFCAVMDAGPRARSGFDLVLNEICEPGRNDFIVEVGSRRGMELLSAVNCPPAASEDVDRVRRMADEAAAIMRRNVQLTANGSLFEARFEHPHWNSLEQRCMACGNCTLVCPTCFCHTIEDGGSLIEHTAERWRQWDSCFNLAFSYIHGGSVRSSIASRYRQWLCHKLSTWQEQFDISGCVGCGRCRTWCPAGIDLIEEFQMLIGHNPQNRYPVFSPESKEPSLQENER